LEIGVWAQSFVVGSPHPLLARTSCSSCVPTCGPSRQSLRARGRVIVFHSLMGGPQVLCPIPSASRHCRAGETAGEPCGHCGQAWLPVSIKWRGPPWPARSPHQNLLPRFHRALLTPTTNLGQPGGRQHERRRVPLSSRRERERASSEM
jgi:hypothetical protein